MKLTPKRTTMSRKSQSRQLADSLFPPAAATRARLTLPLLVAFCLAAPARAENVIEIGYGEGSPGQSGVHVIVTARNDTPIHGYSLAIGYPAEVLTLNSISVQGTHVQALDAEFVAPQIDNTLGMATLGVIFNFEAPSGGSFQPTQLDALPDASSPIIIARLSFHVRSNAPGGTYPLRLVDGLGSPPGFNRFTRAGETVVPQLIDGTFFVAGCDVLALEKKMAFPGVTPNLPILAYVKHCEPLAGFSITIGYKCSALEMVSAGYGQTYLGVTLGNQGLIDFFTTQVDTTIGDDYCRSMTAAVFEYPQMGEIIECPTPTLPPSPDDLYAQSVMRYVFKVLASAGDEKQYQELILDDLGPLVTNNLFLIDDCPQTPRGLDPLLVNGKIYFSLGDLSGRVVEATSGLPVAGARVVTDPDGREATTGADGRFLLTDVIPGSYDLKVSLPFHYPSIHRGVEIAGLDETADAGDLAIYRIPAGTSSPLFRRGFVNEDLRADISDAIWILNWLFQGGQAPTCLQAADINDDGRTDISDAIWFLNFLFGGGTPPPPPFESCGPDPTSSDLTCESIPVCS